MTSQTLDKILNDYSKLTVGRLCKISEVIQDSDSYKNNNQLKDAISLLKSLQKESIYEIFRDLKYCIDCASEGKEYNISKIYKQLPSKD